MGISLVTAMIIQDNGDDILCQAGGPDPETGKFVGWICLARAERGPRLLLNTEPIYDTLEAAEEAMKKIVAEVRKLPIDSPFTDKPV